MEFWVGYFFLFYFFFVGRVGFIDGIVSSTETMIHTCSNDDDIDINIDTYHQISILLI